MLPEWLVFLGTPLPSPSGLVRHYSLGAWGGGTLGSLGRQGSDLIGTEL